MIKFLQKRKHKEEVDRFVDDMRNGKYNEFRIPKQEEDKPKHGYLFPMILFLCMSWSVLIGSASMYFFLTHGSKLIGAMIFITLPVLWVVSVETIKGELD